MLKRHMGSKIKNFGYPNLYFRLKRYFRGFFVERDRRIIIFLFKKSGLTFRRALDIGCGDCNYLLKLIRDGVVKEGYGIDVSRCYFGNEVKLILVDAQERFPFPDKFFDLVLCFHLLEHLKFPKNCLKEAYRVLKNDGVLVLIVPGEIIKGMTVIFGSLFILLKEGKLIAPSRIHIHRFDRNKLYELFKFFPWKKIIIKKIRNVTLCASWLVIAVK